MDFVGQMGEQPSQDAQSPYSPILRDVGDYDNMDEDSGLP